jgi:hypothetical protein
VAIEDAPVTLARLWREMTPEQRTTAARAFWTDGDSVAQQVEAVTYLASHLHFRPQSILSESLDRKVRQLVMLTKPPEGVVARVLVVYHLATQRPMLSAFLGHLDIPHKDGLIADTMEKPPTSDALASAVAALASAYPVDDVRLYLRTLAVQDPETWGGLIELSQSLPPSPKA